MSQSFARSLLAAHATLLAIFLGARWLHAPVTDAIQQLISPPSHEVQRQIARRVTSKYILTTILTAVIIGCLCARSLHYQFYSYIAWATPFLLWRSGQPPVVIYAVWAIQEWAWNVYPSTTQSSMAVVACLKVTVLAVLVGTEEDESADAPSTKAEEPKSR